MTVLELEQIETHLKVIRDTLSLAEAQRQARLALEVIKGEVKK